MHQLSCIFSLVLLCISAEQYGQPEISLVKQKKQSTQRTISFDEKFEIKVGENSYNTKIIKVSETHISILEQSLKQTAAKVTEDKHPYNWFYDTLNIPIQQIDYVKGHRYKNRRWVIPFASVAVLTIGSVFFTPVVSAVKGKKAADKLALFQIGIIAITLPPALIGARKVKYDLRKKWKLKIVD